MTAVAITGVGATEVVSRSIDAVTARLNVLAAGFQDVQQTRIRAGQRGDTVLADVLKKVEDQAARALGGAMKDHALWSWLKERKGLGGPRTAQAIARIGDPRRFPGQPCSEGHYLPPGYEVGAPCPIESVEPVESGPESGSATGGLDDPALPDERPESEHRAAAGPGMFTETDDVLESDSRAGLGGPDAAGKSYESELPGERCPGTMLSPRATTGVRSLWHYAGLHVVDGRLPKQRKGQQGDWSPQLRTLCVGPKGLADQIVLHRTEPYRERYDEVKAAKRLIELPPWRAEKIAKTVAVKAFLGDLLMEWKRLAE